MQRRSKKFYHQITTDGMSVSLLFTKNNAKPNPESFEQLKKLQQEKYDSYGRKFLANHYKTVIDIDPGYKLYLAEVIKDMANNTETLLRLSSKEFHSMMRQNCRDRNESSQN